MIALKNFWHSIKRYKTSSIINVLGLAVSFAALYVILVQVNFDLSYNKDIKDSEKIFRFESDSWFDETTYSCYNNRPLAESLISNLSIIETGGLGNILGTESAICYDKNGSLEYGKLYFGQFSISMLDVFSFETVEGDLKQMTQPHTALLSRSAAERLGLHIGDVVYSGTVKNSENEATIVGIFEDFPKNTDLHRLNAIVDIAETEIDSWGEWSYNYYMKLHNPDDYEGFQELVTNYMTNIAPTLGFSEDQTGSYIEKKFRLNPIRDTYFSKDVSQPAGLVGNSTTTYSLLCVAILVVIIALINFINFFFALVPARIKSVNMYKIYGSPSSALRFNFIFEALALVVMAILLAFGIIDLIKSSSIAGYISASLDFGENISVVFITLLSAIFIALIGSVYPSYYITSFSPAFAIKGSFSATKSGKRLRDILIGLQYIISLSLIIVAMFIKIQHSYMMKYDMGFDKENLLATSATINISGDIEKRDIFTNKLLENTMIEDAAWAAGDMVAESRMGWGRDFKGEVINFQTYVVSWDFLRFMGIEILEGRDFTATDEIKPNGSFIFNQKAKKEFGITLEDQIHGHTDEDEIIGFCKDFNFKPLQYGVEAFAFYVFGENAWSRPNHLYVRTTANADIEQVSEYIKNCVVEFDPSARKENIDVKFFNEELGAKYEKEQRLASLITLFTILSIIISLMGVFGMVMIETQFRRKEIGIRRVLGSTIQEILFMFNKKFIKIVLICFTISIPISFFFVDRWLNTFSYRTPMHWWIFAVALIAVLVITLIIVTIRSWAASTENPVESIKTE